MNRCTRSRVGGTTGIGLPQSDQPEFIVELAKASDWQIYFQSANADEVRSVSKAANRAGLLGSRVFTGQGGFDKIHLADNLAGAVLVSPAAARSVQKKELLRALHPQGHTLAGETGFQEDPHQ